MSTPGECLCCRRSDAGACPRDHGVSAVLFVHDEILLLALLYNVEYTLCQGEDFMEYSIGEFSRKTGLGIHTLRYYEHEGLLLPERTAANRRCYSERDVAWAAFILRLKETGMPIREIRRYAALRAEGDDTLSARMEMLIGHRANLAAEVEKLHAHMEALDAKIAFYCEAIEEYGKE